MKERKILWIGIVVLAGLLLLAGVTTLNKQKEFNGVEISPAPAAPAFSSLTNQDGQRVDLKTYQDKVVLLFFGYTSCPDICPATMGRLKQVVADLGDNKDEVVVMMITTDPERDTQEQLGNYLGNFDPDFLGLTGPISNLEETWKDYGVTVLDRGATHSTRVYVIDQFFRVTLPILICDFNWLLRESLTRCIVVAAEGETKMRKLKLQVQMTVDGYMAGPNGEMDWMVWDWDDELKHYVIELTEPVDCIVLGRKLAQGFIPHWAAVAASPDHPEFTAGKKFTGTHKVVFTKSLDRSELGQYRFGKGRPCR